MNKYVALKVLTAAAICGALPAYAEVSPKDQAAAHSYFAQAETCGINPGMARKKEQLVDLALKLDPQPKYIAEKAQLLFNDARSEDAHALLSQWLKKFPDSPYLLTKEGDFLFAEGDMAGSARVLEKSLRIYPHQPRACEVRYQICDYLKKPDEALVWISKAITERPKFCWYYFHRSKLYAAKRDFKAALKDADSSIAVFDLNQASNLSRMHINRARILCEMKRFAEANRDLTAALATNTDERQVAAEALDVYTRLGNRKMIDLLTKKLRSFDSDL